MCYTVVAELEGGSLDRVRISPSVLWEKVQGVAMTDRVWLKSEGSGFIEVAGSVIKYASRPGWSDETLDKL